MVESGPRLLTADLPGCGGVLKGAFDDFIVEEEPAYQPSGEGEHLFLWVRKRGLSTPEVARRFAAILGVAERDVSYAGLKDRRAVTTQMFCVPAKVEGKIATASFGEGAELLWAKRHRNKLKVGHLRRNRFQIRVTQVERPEAAQPVLDVLAARGLPNYFGPQRFGLKGDNADFGRMLLRGERLPRRPDRFHRRLYLSAYQSLLFNRVLSRRTADGTFDRALAGDLLQKHETRGIFLTDGGTEDNARVVRFEVSATGPMFGPKMPAPQGDVEAMERAVLAEDGVSLEDFGRGMGETLGTRRALRVPLAGLQAQLTGDVLVLSFWLPRGSYATCVLREVMKSDEKALINAHGDEDDA